MQKGNMTVGNPLKAILFFSIPIIIGSVFQHLYNVVDTAVIGHVLGDNSLAALGATSAIYILIIDFANGLTSGFSVILSQLFGAGDQARLRRAVGLTYILTLIISVVVTVVSALGIAPLLRLLNTPAEIYDEALEYLRLILLFAAVTIFYNALAAMLRALGNSKVPLLALVCATVLNIVLDLLFVGRFRMGVAGAAWATVIAQAVAALVCLVYIYKKCGVLRFCPAETVFDSRLIRSLLTTGFSMALMLVVVSIGTVTLQGSINAFGARTITAHNTARKIDALLMLPMGAISSASATFAGQNFGAGKLRRVKKGIIATLGVCAAWSVLAVLCVYTAGGALVRLLTGTADPEVISTAVLYMRINIPFVLPLGVLLSLRNCLQGMGRKLVPIAASVMELVTKLIGVRFLAPAMGYLGVCILEPIIWVVGAVMVAVAFLLVCRKEDRKSPLAA